MQIFRIRCKTEIKTSRRLVNNYFSSLHENLNQGNFKAGFKASAMENGNSYQISIKIIQTA